MSTERARALTEQLSAALAARDVDAVAALLADDVVLQLSRSLDVAPVSGRADVAAALVRNPNPGVLQDDTLQRETTLTMADGDGALVRGALTARTVDGEAYAEELVWIYAWSDGKLVHAEEVGDTLRALDAGVIEDVPAWS